MMTMNHALRRLLVLPLALGLAACSNPVEQEDHPEGLLIVDAQGDEAARSTVAGGTTGQVDVGLTGSTTFTVHALAEDGDLITIDGDELAIEIDQVAAGWTVTLQGTNQLVVAASAAGTGTVRVTLLHEGHAELAGVFTLVAS